MSYFTLTLEPAVVLTAIAFMAACWCASIGLARRRLKASRDAVAETAIQMAQLDIVTGLLNRSGLGEGLTGWTNRTGADDRFAIVAIELEGLCALNMVAGHTAGDDALVQAASLIFDWAGQDALVARLDAGAFVLALPGTTNESFMRRLRELRMKLDCSIVAAGRPFNPNVAVGIALYPRDGSDSEHLVRRAYTALQSAKSTPPERLSFFEAGLETGLVEHECLEHELALAVSEDRVEPHFQPIVRFSDGHIVGYEILARWPHDRRGLIAPAVFIPLAEQTGLLATLTLNLLRRACASALHWPTAPRLALNLSPGLLSEPAMAFCILNVLKACEFPAARLEIEITETDLIADFEPARANLTTLRSRGVRVALDDFGIGHSSLTRLSELPVDIIKIDQSFVTAIEDRGEARAIVAAIVKLAASLDLIVTAEGVESEALARELCSLGCDQGQGYWLGPPHKHLLSVPVDFATPLSERWLGADAAGRLAQSAPPHALRH